MEHINAQLIEIIFTLSRLMKDQMASRSDLSTLSFLQVQALVFLSRNKDVQMTDVAEAFRIELPSATSLVQKLVVSKLVARKTEKKDRRKVKVVLTEKGKKLLKTAMRKREKKIQNYLSLLSENEKKQLLHILKKMIIKMEEQNEK